MLTKLEKEQNLKILYIHYIFTSATDFR